MTSTEWERIWQRYINTLTARDALVEARECGEFGQRPTRRQLVAADMRVAKAIQAIRRVDVRFANAVCPAYWL